MLRSLGWCLGWVLAVSGLGPLPTRAVDFRLAPERPTHDRWMYPFNFQPGVRPVAPTYGSFDPRFDTRDAQFLLGWDTPSLLATNAGPARYLIRRVRVTITSVAPIAPNRPFLYDPTHDAFETYLGTQPGALPDSDPGRPIELFGLAYRGDYNEATFVETSPYGTYGNINSGTVSIASRYAYAATFDTHGVLIDIANNVGQWNTNWTAPPFEVRPWAVGITSAVAAGGEVPDGGTMNFDVDLTDPFILEYLQRGLDVGRVRLAVSSLSPAGQSTPGGTGVGGGGAYPWWATKENLLYDPPKIVIEGTLVSELDVDGDGLPDDWERFWFGSTAAATSAAGDADGDGASNAQEYLAGTDPTSAASVLRILNGGFQPDGRPEFLFQVAASRAYLVEGSEDLARWKTIPGSLTYSAPGLARWSMSAPPTDEGPFRFYRLRAATPPR